MASYEEKKYGLENLLQEILSDQEDPFPNVDSSSDNYVFESNDTSCDENDGIIQTKRRKSMHNKIIYWIALVITVFRQQFWAIKEILDAYLINQTFKTMKFNRRSSYWCIWLFWWKLVSCRGRLMFREYIQIKGHKFGIKMFQLCLSHGYTYVLKVYCGKEIDGGILSVSTKVVMRLMNDCFDSGRTLRQDNYYTSVALAQQLRKRNTHLVGTLRKNRKDNPNDVLTAKLRTGQYISGQSNRGWMITKWKDKRHVIIFITK